MNALDDTIGRHLDAVVAKLDLTTDLPIEERPSPGARRRRRGFDPRDYSGLATLSLVDENGILRWVYQSPARGPAGRRRRRAAIHIGARPISEITFKETPPNRVIAEIEKLDEKLTSPRGLRCFRGSGNNGKGAFELVNGPLALKGRVLLLVHGTFSKSDMFVDEFGAVDGAEKGFLARAAAGGKYDAILAFDHPTLSVSPWINALDLEDALFGVTGPIDVICHSRGGLVVAWWLRNAKRNVDNVVFVGAPLDGTSLASPSNLRAALQGMTGAFKALEATSSIASTVLPFMSVVTGLAAICGGILQFGASTPLADAAVAIVPGLAGQSRVGNSAELLRLHRSQWISTPASHAVVSNFQPSETDSHWWEVWKKFANPKLKVLDWGADAVFQRDNDLVVDTASMTLMCGGAINNANIYDFKTSQRVHHCNYFRQPETVSHIRKALKIN